MYLIRRVIFFLKQVKYKKVLYNIMDYTIKVNKIISYYQYMKGNRSGRRYVTKEGRAYQKVIQQEILNNNFICLEDKVKVNIKFIFTGRDKDLDNCVKPVLDALEGFVYTNDKNIYSLNLEKEKGDENIIFIQIFKL